MEIKNSVKRLKVGDRVMVNPSKRDELIRRCELIDGRFGVAGGFIVSRELFTKFIESPANVISADKAFGLLSVDGLEFGLWVPDYKLIRVKKDRA